MIKGGERVYTFRTCFSPASGGLRDTHTSYGYEKERTKKESVALIKQMRSLWLFTSFSPACRGCVVRFTVQSKEAKKQLKQTNLKRGEAHKGETLFFFYTLFPHFGLLLRVSYSSIEERVWY